MTKILLNSKIKVSTIATNHILCKFLYDQQFCLGKFFTFKIFSHFFLTIKKTTLKNSSDEFDHQYIQRKGQIYMLQSPKPFKKIFSILFDPLKKSYFYDEKKGFCKKSLNAKFSRLQLSQTNNLFFTRSMGTCSF